MPSSSLKVNDTRKEYHAMATKTQNTQQKSTAQGQANVRFLNATEAKAITDFVGRVTAEGVLAGMPYAEVAKIAARVQANLDEIYGGTLRFDQGGRNGSWFFPVRTALNVLRARIRALYPELAPERPKADGATLLGLDTTTAARVVEAEADDLPF